MKARVLSQDIDSALRINEGLPVLERTRGSGRTLPTREEIAAASLVARTTLGRQPYRKLTIHRYYPKQDVGGVAGILNFQSERLAALMALGFQDAINHDCERDGCVLPDQI